MGLLRIQVHRTRRGILTPHPVAQTLCCNTAGASPQETSALLRLAMCMPLPAVSCSARFIRVGSSRSVMVSLYSSTKEQRQVALISCPDACRATLTRSVRLHKCGRIDEANRQWHKYNAPVQA